jgi:hypothetical protein
MLLLAMAASIVAGPVFQAIYTGCGWGKSDRLCKQQTSRFDESRNLPVTNWKITGEGLLC